MNDEPPPSSALQTSGKRLNQLPSHYQEIGDALIRSESEFLTFGVPFIWQPVEKASSLPATLKVLLSNIPTSALEMYSDDLETLDFKEASFETLSLSPISFEKRYLPVLIVSILSFLGTFFSATLLSEAHQLPWISGFFALLVGVGVSLSLSSETYRRACFSNALAEEIRRRSGGPGDLQGGGIGRLDLGQS